MAGPDSGLVTRAPCFLTVTVPFAVMAAVCVVVRVVFASLVPMTRNVLGMRQAILPGENGGWKPRLSA